MKKKIIGIVDYGAGNCASVKAVLTKLGYRTRLISKESDLDEIEILILPGVGAFSAAMKKLHEMNLVKMIQNWSNEGRPTIGICLGMQLLADLSYEHGYTTGLGLIPGEVSQLTQPTWHIGWNAIEVSDSSDQLFSDSDGAEFYFNHSFEFKAPKEYVLAYTRINHPVVAIVGRRNIIGMQFHPEKSQVSGRNILKNVIEDLLCSVNA